MAAAVNGKVSLVTTTGETFHLQYSIDALVMLEERLDLNVMEIGQQMQEGMRLGTLRAVLWAGLQEHHEISEKAAGELIPLVDGGALAITNKVAEAFVAAFPTTEAAKGKADPQRAKAGAGTGKASS